MGSEQYQDGTVKISNASILVVGDGTDWKNEISTPAIFRVSADGEPTYSIATIISATRMHLSANYSGSSGSGLDYTIGRSFTSNRGYWRILNGDNDFADILSQETIDKIDDDVGNIVSGNATIDGTVGTSFGIDTDGNTLMIKSTNLSASRYYHFPDYNASIPSGIDITRANASIATNASSIANANASIDYLQPNPQLKTSNYQILVTDNMILASGNITITLASASAKHSIKLGNRSLDSNASILIKKSGGDTIESNASLNLANKYDTVCLVGDGVNTHFQF